LPFSNADIDAAVAKMYATGRVKKFIHNALHRKDDYAVQAGERRIEQILSAELKGESKFHNDFMRYVQAYEAVLREDGGRGKTATYTRLKVERVGSVQTMIDLLEKPPTTYGIDLLRKKGRLDCAYENIVFDYPDFFERKHLVEARRRLGPVKDLLPPFPILADRT
jgi:hypothetical protein